jgi:hypothetical protein
MPASIKNPWPTCVLMLSVGFAACGAEPEGNSLQEAQIALVCAHTVASDQQDPCEDALATHCDGEATGRCSDNICDELLVEEGVVVESA